MALALDDELEALLQDVRSAPARGGQHNREAGGQHNRDCGRGPAAKKTKGPAGGDEPVQMK